MVNNVDLLSPFPQEVVRKAPAGKFGDYVPHALYVERLRDSGVKYTWQCEAVYGTFNGEKRIVGAKGTITIEDMGSYDGFGDVDTFKLGSPKFNDAAIKYYNRAYGRYGGALRRLTDTISPDIPIEYADAILEMNPKIMEKLFRDVAGDGGVQDTLAMFNLDDEYYINMLKDMRCVIYSMLLT